MLRFRTKLINMAIQGLSNIRKALSSLNPKQIREASEKPVHLILHTPDAEGFRRMKEFFLHDLGESRRRESEMLISRGPSSGLGNATQIPIYDERLSGPSDSLVFHPDDPHSLIVPALDKYPDDGVALARYFQPFRKPFAQRVIQATCRENALFSVTTALPDVIPSLIELPWAVAEFASDTAFLTMNQVRMAFQLAAASDREIGYLEQKSEIAAVIGSAFGWKALARQVVGKIPFGGGLIGKAAVAYAGTRVLGLSLDRYYATGYVYTRQERKHMYRDAFDQGKKVAQKILAVLKPDAEKKLSARRNEKNSSG